MLVEDNDADLIAERYPGAIDGDVPFLEPVVANDRYSLLRVTDSTDTTSTTDSTGTSSDNPNTVPNQSGNIGSAPPIITNSPEG